MDVQAVQKVAQQREGWRLKHRNFTAPRVSADVDAKAALDPFVDVETLKPINLQSHDPLKIDEGFLEVPDSMVDPQHWQVDFSCGMIREEAITILESRGVVAAFRRRARALKHFYKRILHLNENLATVLGLEKGRSTSFPMLRACRRLCALALGFELGFLP